MKVQAIIAAAGAGTRLKSKVPKPLLAIKGQPILFYSLKVFAQCSLIDSVIVVVPSAGRTVFEKAIKKSGIRKKVICVAGGARRCDSVRNGLRRLDADTKLVVVHDGARPFITHDLLRRCIHAGRKDKAVVAAVPVTSTIKRVCAKTGVVWATLNREDLWEIQTPQVFDRKIIGRAYSALSSITPTDDAQLVEQAGSQVKIVLSSYDNIKITAPEDVAFAEYLLSRRKSCSESA